MTTHTPDRTSAGDATAVSPPLEYQPGEPVRRRRRRRRLLGIVLAAALVVVGVWKGPAADRRLLLAYLERQARRYVAPPDRVVYEEDPTRWPALLAQPGYFIHPPNSTGWNGFAAYSADPVARFVQASKLRLGPGALFAHARRTPSGRERLVVVWLPYNAVRPTAQGASPDNQVQITLFTSVVDDGVMIREGRAAPWIAPPSNPRDRQTPLYARLYAGQADPADPSHFTIPFEIGDHRDVLDGYLRDGDAVILRPRNHEHMLNPK
jgi:hypothetical protein